MQKIISYKLIIMFIICNFILNKLSYAADSSKLENDFVKDQNIFSENFNLLNTYDFKYFNLEKKEYINNNLMLAQISNDSKKKVVNTSNNNIKENKYSYDKFNKPIIPYKHHSLQLMTENDLYSILISDRYYTNGLRIKYTSKEYDYDIEDNPMSWGGKVTLAFINKPHVTRYYLGLGHEMYSPILHAYIERYPYPYAAFMYLTLGAYHRDNNKLERIGIEGGYTGPYAFGKETQDFIHSIINAKKFKGWEHQIEYEPIINLTYSLSYKSTLYDSKKFDVDVIPTVEASLGNADTHIGVSGIFRIGYNLHADFGPSYINHMLDQAAPHSDDTFVYFFMGLGTQVIFRNMFVEGNSFGTGLQTGYTLNFFKFTSSAGIVFGRKGYRVGYMFSTLNREYLEQTSGHSIGTLFIDISI